MWTTSRIRKHFLDYFAHNGHQVVSSAPLVPRNDPSLLFTSAGMVPFKNYFTGTEKTIYPTATSAQKCLRAGGKHNDLENVGYTSRHHTFFEMLGNFSFGDYFKEQAINHAWTLLTKEFGLAKDRLVITVYANDDNAIQLWCKIAGLSDQQIIRIATSDNFWTMGDTGPCGPCSEIFYDHGDHIAGGPPGSANEDGDRFVEIWNLVFMQYEQYVDSQTNEIIRQALPKPSIDTGSGLERLTAVLQGVHSNYDIDLFKNLIQASVDITGVNAEHQALVSHRVIADHLRASCFLMADGISPSNEGRGYVLRRIMRRAMRHSYLLGYRQPLMHQLVSTLVHEMGEHYSELTRAQAFMIDVLYREEERFRETLGRGLKLLNEETRNLSVNDPLPGQSAFKLYDTYGFPLDLTQDILRGEGRIVDLPGFDSAMAKQKADARLHWSGSGEKQTEALWLSLREQTSATEFLGYTMTTADALVHYIIKDDQTVHSATVGEDVYIITNQTPFYAESGGQMGDRGYIRSAQGLQVDVLNTIKKANDLYVHHVRIIQGTLKVSDTVTLVVDDERRRNLRAHHSATHLLHACLRKHLGDHVVQKGSLVAPDRLRFDFSHNSAVSDEQLNLMEAEINTTIRRNIATTTQTMSPDEALKTGAVALFGEKYGDEVRVVTMAGSDQHDSYSIEFCGGTHVERSGDIGYFKIIAESGVAAGIRRIEAVTGSHAESYMRQKDQLLQSLKGLLKATDEQILPRLQQFVNDKKSLERTVKDLQIKLRSQNVESVDISAQTLKVVNGINYLTQTLTDIPAQELKAVVDHHKQKIQSGVIVVTSTRDGKISIVVGVTQDLVSNVNAVELVKIAAQILSGQGGGGRAEMAQAGGSDASAIPQAFYALEKILMGIKHS